MQTINKDHIRYESALHLIYTEQCDRDFGKKVYLNRKKLTLNNRDQSLLLNMPRAGNTSEVFKFSTS